MSNCTDCIPQVSDPCKGEKKSTECILSLRAIPSLGIAVNEPLDTTLQKIGVLLQTIFTTIDGYNPNEVQVLRNNQGTIEWVTD